MTWFHGRNAAKWFNHKKQLGAIRLPLYRRRDDALVSRILGMETKADEVYVLYNNCHRGQAALNALRMQELLGLGHPPMNDTLPRVLQPAPC